jgi:capsule polysaccharide export protein KpsE/RkpR
MKKKTSREKKIEKIFQGSEVMVLIEDFNNKIDLMAEGQQAIREELSEFKGEMYCFRDEMYGFKKDTGSNFVSLREYLSHIEDELMEIKADLAIRKKFEAVNKDWMKAMEKRIIKIEAQLQKNKMVVAK